MANQVFEMITIGKEAVRMEHRDVPITAIALDEDNPRLRLMRQKDPDKDMETFIKEMKDAPKLRKDIEENGGLRERVILKPSGKGKFKVVEGNRRRVAFGELRDKHPDDETWQTMPCRILPEDIDDKQIAILLAGEHVQGKVKWDAHEKAGQVYHMAKDLKIPHDEIATVLHVSKSTVQRILKSYTMMMERFRNVDNCAYENQGERKWSFFDELYRSKELRGMVDEDPEFGDTFSRWVGEGRLNKGAQVRLLPKILAHPEARKAFERGRNMPEGKAFDDAMKVIETTEPEQGSDFFKLLQKLREACTDVAKVKEILRIRNDPVARRRVLESYEALRDFMALADVEVPEDQPKRNAA